MTVKALNNGQSEIHKASSPVRSRYECERLRSDSATQSEDAGGRSDIPNCFYTRLTFKPRDLKLKTRVY